MAFTNLSNIVSNTAFTQYFAKAVLDRSKLFKSGIAVADPFIQQKCNEAGFGGNFVNLPFFNAITTGSNRGEQRLDESDLQPQNITAGQDIAPIIRRGKAFGSNDIAADVAGADPIKVIADQLADYWNKQHQKALMNVLTGVFGANATSYNADTAAYGNDGDAVLDLSANTMTTNDIMLAAQLLGDRGIELNAVAMNSAVNTFLSTINSNGSYRASENPSQLATYNGRAIVTDDNVPYNPTTGVATVYLFGRGAVAFNDVPTKTPFETYREALKGNDGIVSRTGKIVHLRGWKWNGTASGVSPTNSELATANKWLRVYPQKAVRCVKLVVKCA
jgi:hypothetical protein